MLNIQIQPIFCVILAFTLIIIPFPLIFAWVTAVLVHELFHVLAIKLFGKQILSVKFGLHGAVIETRDLTNVQEMICALAGPLGGFCLIIFAKQFPLLAIFGFVQSIFNLLPLFSFDGGRVLKCLLKQFVQEEKAENIFRVTEKTISLLLVLLCVIVFTKLQMIILSIMLCLFLLVKRKLTCKASQQRVQ